MSRTPASAAWSSAWCEAKSETCGKSECLGRNQRSPAFSEKPGFWKMPSKHQPPAALSRRSNSPRRRRSSRAAAMAARASASRPVSATSRLPTIVSLTAGPSSKRGLVSYQKCPARISRHGLRAGGHETRLLGLGVELALAVVDPPGVVADVEHRLLGEHVHLRALNRHRALAADRAGPRTPGAGRSARCRSRSSPPSGCRGRAASAWTASPAESESPMSPSRGWAAPSIVIVPS